MIPLTGREELIEKNFRESDSIYVIDDNRMLFLGFSTDNTGLQWLIPKIVKIVENITGPRVEIKVGSAVFPQDGYSFNGLMNQALQSISKPVIPDLKVDQPGFARWNNEDEPGLIRQDSNREDFFKTCLLRAKGHFFHSLLIMDKQLFWAVLSRLSIREQSRFLLRLPYDSPLIGFLSVKIEKRASGIISADQTHELKKLVSNLKFEDRLKERKKNEALIIARLNRFEAVSILPSIALQIYNMALNPSSDVDKMQEIICLDQVLTLKVLKVVNSAYYGLTQRVDSVKEAVVVLGMDEIVNISFGLSLSKAFNHSNLGGRIKPFAMWKHTVATALIGKYISKDLKSDIRSGTFTACILHDIGKLFIIENFPDQYIRIIETSETTGIPIYELEEETFGKNHGEIGGMIAEKWNLPKSLSDAIAFHHHPSLSADFSGLSAIIGFSDFLSNKSLEHGQKLNLNSCTQTLLKDHMNILQGLFKNFTPQVVDEILEDVKLFIEKNNEALLLFS